MKKRRRLKISSKSLDVSSRALAVSSRALGTDSLPLRPFWFGFGSVLDVFGPIREFNEFTLSVDPFGDDARSLHGDWQRVGDGLRDAMGRLKPE